MNTTPLKFAARRGLRAKVLLLILAFSLQPLALLPVRAQYDFTFMCDSNGMLLPGYYVPIAQVTGAYTNSIFSNIVYTPVLLTTSNYLRTNLTANINTSSNFYWAQFVGIWGNGTDAVGSVANPLGTQNNLSLGGTNNTWPVWPMYNAGIFAGRGNLILGQNTSPTTEGSVILGGIANTISWPNWTCGILGGQNNYISLSSWSAIIGGTNNTLQTISGGGSVILGGQRNQILSGNFNTILGGASNTVSSPNHSGNILGGYGARSDNNNCFVWSDDTGLTNTFTTTADRQFLVRALNGMGINTNNPGTNALAVRGWVDASGPGAGFSLNGTNLFTFFSTTNLSILFNFLLTSNVTWLAAQDTATSNALFSFTLSVSNSVVVSSNAARAYTLAVSNNVYTVADGATNSLNTASNELFTFTAGVSNLITSSKAFTCYIPANYADIGIAFATPLMADGNYSVVLTAQDGTTAGGIGIGLVPWIDNKNASGFMLHIPYATNSYNMNFECQVKANSQ